MNSGYKKFPKEIVKSGKEEEELNLTAVFSGFFLLFISWIAENYDLIELIKFGSINITLKNLF